MNPGPDVGLFVTCLVDSLRPGIGFATIKLLEAAGCTVMVPAAQTCCGQPAWNSGDEFNARAIARQVIQTFEPFDYVVAPSGSCVGVMREDYPQMLRDDAQWYHRAQRLSTRAFELTSFLTDKLTRPIAIDARYEGKVTYHDSCSGLRQLGIHAQPRQLLAQVSGLALCEMNDSEVCCGFGGVFCVKYAAISKRLVDDKLGNMEATGAHTVLGGDLGCLLNIAGRLRRKAKPMKVLHVAEVLVGSGADAGIGDPL